MLDDALRTQDSEGRTWSAAKRGCYAFYDFDGQPIYVGATHLGLRERIRRHLTNQRTDAVAMNILDPLEVAELELWPLWELQDAHVNDSAARQRLKAAEYTVYIHALDQVSTGGLLNEKAPSPTTEIPLPPSIRLPLVDEWTRAEFGNPDARLARRAENLARLAAQVFERGQANDGARKALLVQALRVTGLSASRLIYTHGELPPDLRLKGLGQLLDLV
ncbi:GIY-YIG nuclease family protein [Streptomyces gardneri]|nr:GIY-YIG nuclease family protein [Streptomyces gardneri]